MEVIDFRTFCKGDPKTEDYELISRKMINCIFFLTVLLFFPHFFVLALEIVRTVNLELFQPLAPINDIAPISL